MIEFNKATMSPSCVSVFCFFLALTFGQASFAAPNSAGGQSPDGSDFLAEDALLLDDDLLLEDESLIFSQDSPSNEFKKKPQAAWLDHFVTSLSHQQTRTDEGETSYFRHTIRVEYEQAIANGWYARIDAKGTSYQSLDKQALQRGEAMGMATGETYQKAKLQQAWLQYSAGKCAYKLGQQTLIWGEVDGTFTVDDITPFDFTEQLLTDYSSVRLPQLMAVTECFMNKQQAQLFYIPKASLHQSSHEDDEYFLLATNNIDDEDLDAEWGGRYKFSVAKTEIALMYASLVSNFPAQVLPSIPTPSGSILTPIIFDYELYGLSANLSSGQWMFKTDIAYKTDQIVTGTLMEISDQIDGAIGIEFLSNSSHNITAGIWGSYALDHDFSDSQNESTPLFTLGWSKNYFNDDLAMSLLSSGRETPRSISSTAQAKYQIDDYWSASTALTLVDNNDEGAGTNPLQSEDNEISLDIKFQF